MEEKEQKGHRMKCSQIRICSRSPGIRSPSRSCTWTYTDKV